MSRSRRSPRHQHLIQLLATKRESAGLTQVDLARVLGRPQSFVSKYESGERRIDVVELIEITEAIGTSAADIVRELTDIH